MKRILVLCGGQSPEHVISVRSCKNVLKAINRIKFEVVVVGITREGRWALLEEKEIPTAIESVGKSVDIKPGKRDCFWSEGKSLGIFDAVFPILHGPNGEDGTIQGLLQLLGIPFVGCGVLSSAVSMDKDTTKRLLKAQGIQVSNWLLLTKTNPVPSFGEVQKELTDVLFVKPSNMGSSVGVHRVTHESEWKAAVKDAFKYDDRVLVEEEVVGRELECAVLGNHNPKASGVGQVRSGNFYSYEEKYEATSVAELMIPASVDQVELETLKDTAIKAYKVLQCAGLARVDMFITKAGEICVNEVNTMPGFTSISMYPKLWEQEGLGYAQLIDKLINLAVEE